MKTTHQSPEEPFKIVGDWAAQVRQLKAKYTLLTDADLAYAEGKEQLLLARIESRLKKSRAEVISILKKCRPH